MKKSLIILFLFIGVFAKSQTYNPALHTVTNKAIGIAQSNPVDARTYFYDATNFVYRPYVSTSEVLTYLYLSKYRVGQFDIVINTGGSLSSGVITGGTNSIWYFKNGTADSNLVQKIFGASSTDSAIFATNYRVDTAKVNLRTSIAGKISNTLPTGQILAGNLSNVATPVTPGGVLTMTSGGSFDYVTNSVVFSKLQTLPSHSVFGNPTGSTAISRATYLGYGIIFNNDTAKVDTATLKNVFGSGTIGWALTGNSGTVEGTNFLGTIDDIPLSFRVNNVRSGYIGNTSTFNTYYGYGSGLATTTGTGNTSIGSAALASDTSGGNNVAVGFSALNGLTKGQFNTGLGVGALSSVDTGSHNTGIGNNALNAATGNNNTGVGNGAGINVSTGHDNIIVGTDSAGLLPLTTGSYNTIIGANASGFAAGLSSNIILAEGHGAIRLQFDGSGNLTTYPQTTTGDTTTYKADVVDASGNHKRMTFWPGGGSGSGGACQWPIETYNGFPLYSKNSWPDIYDFTLHGAIGLVKDGNYVDISASGAAYTDYITVGPPIYSRYFVDSAIIKVIANSSMSLAFGFGLKTINPTYDFDVLGVVGTTTTSPGAVQLYSSNGTLLASGTSIPSHLNDVFKVRMTRTDTVLLFKVYNLTTGDSSFATYTYTVAGYQKPNACQFAIYTFGSDGVYQLQNYGITDYETRNPNLLVGGDSKMVGYYPSSFGQGYAYQLNSTYSTVVVHAGASDGLSDFKKTLSEIYWLNPRQVLLSIGSNDLRFGASLDSVTHLYDSVVNQLTFQGYQVFHTIFPEDSTGGGTGGGIGLTAFKNYLASKYAANYINTWDTLSTSNVLKPAFNHGDGVHLTPAAQNAIVVKILASGLITTCTSRSASQQNLIINFTNRLDSLSYHNGGGGSGNVTTAGGTVNTLPKFTSSTGIGNSSVTDNGTTVTTSENLQVNAAITNTGYANLATAVNSLVNMGNATDANFIATVFGTVVTKGANSAFTLGRRDNNNSAMAWYATNPIIHWIVNSFSNSADAFTIDTAKIFTNIPSTSYYLKDSLAYVPKGYVDRLFASVGSDTAKVVNEGTNGQNQVWTTLDTLHVKRAYGPLSVSVTTSSPDSGLVNKLVNDTAFTTTLTDYIYGWDYQRGSGALGFMNKLSLSGDLKLVQSSALFQTTGSTYSTGGYDRLVRNTSTGKYEIQQGSPSYFTPATGGTVSASNNAMNIINPSGTLATLTINFPSSPANGDFIEITPKETITAVTFANGTLVKAVTTLTANGYYKFTYYSTNTSWY